VKWDDIVDRCRAHQHELSIYKEKWSDLRRTNAPGRIADGMLIIRQIVYHTTIRKATDKVLKKLEKDTEDVFLYNSTVLLHWGAQDAKLILGILQYVS
jgi:hypothetical protein